MPLKILVRGHPVWRDVGEKELPNSLEVKPQREVSNVQFREEIKILSHVLSNQVGRQRGSRKEGVDTSRIWEFLMMKHP